MKVTHLLVLSAFASTTLMSPSVAGADSHYYIYSYVGSDRTLQSNVSSDDPNGAEISGNFGPIYLAFGMTTLLPSSSIVDLHPTNYFGSEQLSDGSFGTLSSAFNNPSVFGFFRLQTDASGAIQGWSADVSFVSGQYGQQFASRFWGSSTLVADNVDYSSHTLTWTYPSPGYEGAMTYSTFSPGLWTVTDVGEYTQVAPPDLTSPVPEPETYAMLLAGLGMMGAVARRRKASY